MQGELAYYQNLSGLPAGLSLDDYQAAYWASATSNPPGTNDDDSEMAFLRLKTGLNADMDSMRLAYWKSISGLAAGSVTDHKYAAIQAGHS